MKQQGPLAMKQTSDSKTSLAHEGRLSHSVIDREHQIIELTAFKKEKEQLESSLRERIKELNCLYGISEVIEHCEGSMDVLFQETVEFLPASWQYPNITCGRITFETHAYTTQGFQCTAWGQTSSILVGGKPAGTVEVYYVKEMPVLDEGPFLREERLLINAIGERLGRVVERIQGQKRLEIERAALKDMNIALRGVLAAAQDEQQEVGRRLQTNVNEIIIPIVHALENELSQDKRAVIALLKQNLNDIISPFANELSRTFMSLTPAEIRICHMIRDGLSTKDISRLQHLSPVTVSRHRQNIRRKLGLTNQNVNLATYLQNFMSDKSTSSKTSQPNQIGNPDAGEQAGQVWH